ncbi:MAG: MFS transporter, partial [Saprospiraceae bacterium]|nr:MFS transporter [Saprospiraceae bacterium]
MDNTLQTQTIKLNDKRTIWSWAMYDWANSVYMLVITSAIFPAYYNKITRLNGSGIIEVFGFPIENTAMYSINMGLAFGIVALISPLLSSISDFSGNQKWFMSRFCYLGVFGCTLLWWFNGREDVHLALFGVLLATVGYAGSIVFYNSYLPAIASEDQQDKVSARGYTFGYIGATVLLVINLALIMNQEALGVTDKTLMPRIAFLLTALWWAGFAQITFANLPNRVPSHKHKAKHYLLNGYAELNKIWKHMSRNRVLRTFLFGYFFYIMGVQTVLFMAASFGEKEVGLGVTQLIITILLLQFVGIAGAYLFAWLAKKWGNVRSLILAVVIWIGICLGSLFIATPFHFYIAGACIGLVMGGIQ